MLIYYFEFENRISCAVIDWHRSGLGRSDNIILSLLSDELVLPSFSKHFNGPCGLIQSFWALTSFQLLMKKTAGQWAYAEVCQLVNGHQDMSTTHLTTFIVILIRRREHSWQSPTEDWNACLSMLKKVLISRRYVMLFDRRMNFFFSSFASNEEKHIERGNRAAEIFSFNVHWDLDWWLIEYDVPRTEEFDCIVSFSSKAIRRLENLAFTSISSSDWKRRKSLENLGSFLLSVSPWESEVVSTAANWYLSRATSSKCSFLLFCDLILLLRQEGNSFLSR